MKKFLGIAAALAFFGAVSPASAAVNLIQNGSFEDGAYNLGQPNFNTLTAANNPAITSWIIGGSIDWIGIYWNEGPGAGNRSLDLNGLAPGSVSQTIAVTAGQAYEVSFLMAGNPAGVPAIKTLDVITSSSGAHGFSFDTALKGVPDPMGWTQKSFTFVALGSSETITFASTTFCCEGGQNPLAFGPALDLVSVSAVPEPSTWAMMLLGFAGVGYFAWRRNKKAAVAAA